jgi:hypothetical protein
VSLPHGFFLRVSKPLSSFLWWTPDVQNCGKHSPWIDEVGFVGSQCVVVCLEVVCGMVCLCSSK